MFHDARQLPTGTVLQTDLCIVGGGAAGITLAHALRDSGLHVLLLESGGLDLEEPTQALYAGELRGVPNFDPDTSRLRYFGGSTNHWGGWCRPLDPWDFTAVAGQPLRAWPFGRAELDPYYRRAQVLCELGPFDYDDITPWQKAAGLQALPLDGRKLRTALFQVSPPTRFGAAYHDALAQAPNVAVWLHANALELETDATAGQVTAVRATSLDGPEFRVAARAVVLATGGLENARLLLLSNRTQAAGLGNGHDMVGRCFMDHPWLPSAGLALFAEPADKLRLYVEETAALGTTVFGTLAPGMAEPETGGFRVVLRPVHRVVQGVDALKSIGGAIGDLRLPDRFWYKLGRAASDYDAVIDSAFRSLFGTRRSLFGSPQPGESPVVGAHIDVNMEQFPNRDSRVTLGTTLDALGQRRLVLDWRPGAAEKRTLRRALDLVAQEFGRIGLGRVRLNPLPDGAALPEAIQGSRHHIGTTRMAEDPRLGVVDAQCRVHGVANLYIAGSSVFATSGFANPTLTIVALALRLADTVQKRIGQG